MREQQDDQKPSQQARANESKDRERKQYNDRRYDGDADNPLICRGID
jgi:hypothetical protein